jgi:signal transduction histidine kinase
MADAQQPVLSYGAYMVLRKPLLFWLRWGGLLAGWVEIALMAQSIAHINPSHRILLYAGMSVGAILYGFLFVNNISLRVNLAPQRERWILAQLFLGALLNLELMNLSAICVPFCVPVRQRIRWFWITVGFSLAGYIWMIIIFRNQVHPPLSQLLHSLSFSLVITIILDYCGNLFWHLLCFVIGCVIFELARRQQQLAVANQELIDLQAEIRAAAKVEERFRLSRELHDAAGHYLTSLSIQLEIAQHRATEAALPAITRAQLITRLLLAEIRESVSAWREDETVDISVALKRILRDVTGLQTHLEIEGNLVHIPSPVAHGLYRCAQEAVTNVLRHSEAKNLWIQLIQQDAIIQLSIKDDGCGCNELMEGNGLRGIQSRAEEMRGTLEFSSPVSGGFIVTLKVPTGEERTA